MNVKGIHIYPNKLLEQLNFDFILQQLMSNCIGSLGRSYLATQDFFTNEDKLKEALQATHEVQQLIILNKKLPFSGFDELPFLNQATIENYVLDIEQIIQLYYASLSFQQLYKLLHQKELQTQCEVLYDSIKNINLVDDVILSIQKTIHIDQKIINESVSPKLNSIRSEIRQTQHKIQSVFNKALLHYKQQDFLADTQETVRNSRRVLAVRSEFKRQIKGIIVDESNNGTITFIEPEQTVALNNELLVLFSEEKREIYKILATLTKNIQPFISDIHIQLIFLAYWDSLQAKANYALQNQLTIASVSKEKSIYLKNFIHPVLQYHHQKNKKPIVANTLWLDKTNNFLVISGPNAGGKSIVLKSVGLIQLMFQFGMAIPVEEGSHLPCLQHFFIDIGDEQSIENDVSTYSAHLQKMKYFLQHANGKTLILLDELGVGTDPSLGGAMAEAIIQLLQQKHCLAVITTHFNNIKLFAAQTNGFQSAAMAFDKQNLKPLYQLQIGQPGSSFTFEIAKQSNLPNDVIQLAKEKTGINNKVLDETLSDVQIEKQYIKGLRKNVQKKEQQLTDLVANYEQLKKDLEKEKKKLIKSHQQKLLEAFNEQSRALEKMMRDWKESENKKEQFTNIRQFIDDKRIDIEKNITQEEQQAFKATKGTIEVGNKVKLEDGIEVGEVLQINGKKATVLFGQMKTTVKLSQLQKITETTKKQNNNTNTSYTSKNITEKSIFDYELDIRGLMKDEAFTALDNFFDKALMYGISKVKIVHGRGSGALRTAVQNYLKNYPFIAQYYYEKEQFGGNGATIAELK
ncbi:MAG: Smr/MutS family protein [Chitinophagales bacterium]|nr:Smr/MutS family protein [Chitinophagales bacterium]